MKRLREPLAMPGRSLRASREGWMRRAAVLLAACLALACADSSPSPTARPTSLATKQTRGATYARDAFLLTRERAFLYEVSSPDGGRTVLYLLGSIHASDLPIALASGLAADLARADALVLELDPRSISEGDAGDLMLHYGMLVPPERLEDRLSPETLERLRERVAEPDFTPVERQLVELMQPWAISMILLEKQLAKVNAPAANGVDLAFANAVEEGVPVLALETAGEQIAALASLSPTAAETLLREALEGSGSNDFAELQAIWRSGDARALERLYFEDESLDEIVEVLILTRNERMTAGLEALLAEAPDRLLFVVIGAAHLVGDQGVPAALARAGYRVVRVGEERPSWWRWWAR
jgi:uncharacterized protein YbaP (TraB family)